MFKSLQRMSLARFKQILAVILIIFLTSGIILFWVNSAIVERAVVGATEKRMLILARAGAKSVEDLLSLFGSELVILADKKEIKDFNLPKARQLMMEVILTANHPMIHQFGLISKNGILQVIANKEGERENEGNSLADRNYFQWAKTAKKREVFLSEPIVGRSGINKGKWVVVAATPIIGDDGSFNGVLFAPIRVEELTINYIDTLKISATARAFLIDQNGDIVSHTFRELVGKKAQEYANNKKWRGYETYLDLVEKMSKGEEDTKVWWFMSPDGQLKRIIGGFAPIRLGESMISVAVAIPYEEAYNLVRDFFRNQVVWLVFLILVGIVIAFFWTVGLALAKRDGYGTGIKDGAKFERNGRGKKSA